MPNGVIIKNCSWHFKICLTIECGKHIIACCVSGEFGMFLADWAEMMDEDDPEFKTLSKCSFWSRPFQVSHSKMHFSTRSSSSLSRRVSAGQSKQSEDPNLISFGFKAYLKMHHLFDWIIPCTILWKTKMFSDIFWSWIDMKMPDVHFRSSSGYCKGFRNLILNEGNNTMGKSD